MKQAVEEAASEYMNIPPVKAAIKCGDIEDLESHIKVAFESGAEWQSKQSPWISVNDRLPEENIEVIIYHEYEFYIGKMYHSMLSNWWRINKNEADDIIADEDDLWMPIPSFDEILEANRDVLERIKEKGD